MRILSAIISVCLIVSTTCSDAGAKAKTKSETKPIIATDPDNPMVPLGGMIPYFGDKLPYADPLTGLSRFYVWADGKTNWPDEPWVPQALRKRPVPDMMSGEYFVSGGSPESCYSNEPTFSKGPIFPGNVGGLHKDAYDLTIDSQKLKYKPLSLLNRPFGVRSEPNDVWVGMLGWHPPLGNPNEKFYGQHYTFAPAGSVDSGKGISMQWHRVNKSTIAITDGAISGSVTIPALDFNRQQINPPHMCARWIIRIH